MTIHFILNGEDVSMNATSADRLVDLLRERFGLHGAQADCRRGTCGKCLVLMDGRLAPSCLLPAFKARGREIVTYEGFAQTDEYADIAAGFAEAGVECCGFCDKGKILAAAAVVERSSRPTKEEILAEMAEVPCRCTDPETLVRGVQAAAERREGRRYRRASQ
ncbi:MAG: aldehyde oxidoreductase [Spirochaetaceae bacterium]|nr:aldehyde oxidoreductase [Spirochaetaceae bacterium]